MLTTTETEYENNEMEYDSMEVQYDLNELGWTCLRDVSRISEFNDFCFIPSKWYNMQYPT